MPIEWKGQGGQSSYPLLFLSAIHICDSYLQFFTYTSSMADTFMYVVRLGTYM